MEKKILPSKYAGWEAFAGLGAVNIRTNPGTGSQVVLTASNGMTFGTVVGLWHTRVNGYSWYVIIPTFTTRYKYLYVASGLFKVRPTPKPTAQSTQKLINDTLRNDAEAVKRIINVQIRALQMLRNSQTDRKTFESFSRSAETVTKTALRHQRMIQQYNKYLAVKETLSTMLDKIGLAAVPLIVVVALSAVAGASIVALLYYIFKPAYNESVANLHISDKLAKALSTLPDSDRQQVINDLENQIDRAYNQGRTDQAFASVGSVAKYALVGVGIYMLLNTINNNTH